MRSIDRIIITCWRGDFWLTRICIASIRYWYPEIPIGLLKDTSQGEFSTTEVETIWNVSVVAAPNPPRGIFTKLEAFYLPGRQRILLLDSDTLFLGRILDFLAGHEEDFVGNWGGTRPLTREEKFRYAKNGYYDLKIVREKLPDFDPPDYFFNSGHLLITSSLFPRERFESWLSGSPPAQTAPFPPFLGRDQGLMNLILAQLQQEGKCSLGHCDFVRYSIHKEMVWDFEIEQLKTPAGYPFLIHWAQEKPFHKTGMIRADLLGFFENFYYSRIPQGEWKRAYRLLRRARKEIRPGVLKLISLSRKRVDLEKLICSERNPGKEPDPTAYIS